MNPDHPTNGSDFVPKSFDGSWVKAMQVAGLRAQSGSKLDFKQMVAAFKDCWRLHNSVPSRRQLENYLEKRNCPFRYRSYMNIYGGLGKLAEMIVAVQDGNLHESALY